MSLNSPVNRRSSRPSTRVSLACAPCRSKHLRCDATTPVCARCSAEGTDCVYLKSRRGGKKRRIPSTDFFIENNANPPGQVNEESILIAIDSHPGITEDEQSVSEPTTNASIYSDTPSDSSMAEQLLSQYYTCFHAPHPCVLPQWAMKQQLAADGSKLQTLNLVMQYIGGIFAKSPVCPLLKSQAEQAVSSLPICEAISGFDVQATLLLSIAIYWCDEIEKALGLLDKSIEMALRVGMNKRTYTRDHGMNRPLLEESWRRTWWQIVVTDAHIAGSTNTYPFRTSKINTDVDLPCDEESYESGNILPPRTLEDYDMREFMGDDSREFSSFAELVGITRSLDIALAARQTLDIGNAALICANMDAAVTAWQSLLPASKKDIVRGDGTFDEILFKANMIIHTYTVDLHRRLSTLMYSPIEAVSRCAPQAPPESLRGCNSLECKLHTAKVLRAIEQFDDLLTLPTNIATHTPFIICMIANTVIAHLAACRFHYQGHPLRLARERIRMAMGALKVMGEFWPMGLRTYREVGIVAREILGLKNPAPVGPETQGELEVSRENLLLNQELLVSDIHLLGPNFDFCGMFDLNVSCV